MKCPQCDAEHSAASNFCSHCGSPFPKTKESKKGSDRQCRNCGQFNELDDLFCVSCGEKMIKETKETHRKPSENPSYKKIALVIGIVLLIGLSLKLGLTLFKDQEISVSPETSISPALPKPRAPVEETQVIAVAKNFKCPCGGCGELPLATCECDMPKGAVETKNFIRVKLAEGFSVEQVIELVAQKYGHRI